MLLSARYLIDRLRHPRSRAEDAAALRRRLASAAAGATPEEAAIARDLRRLREQLAAAIGEVEGCSRCARGHPLPHGRFAGGHCCGTRTEQVFTADEAAALALAGTSMSDLRLPEGDHAGCAFRGEGGCSLAVADRPNICVRYLCRELEDELRERGDLREIKVIAAAIARAFERLRALRAARIEAQEAR